METKHQSLPQFVLWSNRGADFMGHRQFMDAIVCFSEALLAIQKNIQIRRSASSRNRKWEKTARVGDLVDHIVVTPLTQPPASAETLSRQNETSRRKEDSAHSTPHDRTQKQGVKIDSGKADHSLLFCDPVRFLPTVCNVALMELLQPISVLVFVNLAIARHHQALEDRCSDSVRRSIKLYEMILRNKSQEICLQPLGNIGFQLMLGCYNNLGHAHRSIRLTRRAEACFESLLSLLMWSVVHRVSSKFSMDRYWVSIQHLVLSPRVVALAA